jgi:dTDP-4-dehydrorhamnose 3,5-epimerase
VIFRDLGIPGAFLVEPERVEDERGFFARTWCEREFAEHGIEARTVQCNVSFNRKRGTLRGMHYSVAPGGEQKLVRCTRGRVHDVLLDLRPESPAYLQWRATELSADNRLMLFVPLGVAHGFVTLEAESEVFYQMTEFYDPACARGVRWNDPAFGIEWPEPVRVISDRDAHYPDHDRGAS